jgi:ABC-type multidrug transport system fused ATPase/permease subunit
VIKAYGAEAFEQERFEAQSSDAFAAAYRARNLYATLCVAVFWLAGAVLLIATALAALATRDGTALFAQRLLVAAGFSAWTLGRFNLFKSVAGAGTQGVESLFKLWARAQDVAVGLDRVFALLDREPEVQDAPDAVRLPSIEHNVAFRGVRFGYRSDAPTLQDIDLEARVGTVTAIAGPTGAGKSTLMSLLLRLFDPDAGSITIDGFDLRAIQLASLRENVSIALQENLLFGATVRENIRYAVPNASDAAVREAARVAHADAFIRELPAGYDTVLGERGAKLSTGQRQRLSIARAVLKDTPILILDEPTASLDAETEFRVLKNLAEWGRGRVIFLITHRLSTVRRADQIVVLEGGRIVERGSHDDLMKLGGTYHSLLRHEPAQATAEAPL